MFSGHSQSTGSVSTMLDFNPVFNIGDDNKSASEKTTDYSNSASAKQDNSLGLSASVGVGVGGSGSGGLASTTRIQDDMQPTETAGYQSPINNKNFLLIGIVVAVLGGGFLAYKKFR